MLVRFEEMIEDPTIYMTRANQRFGLDLAFEDYDETVEQAIMRKVPGKVEKHKAASVIKERRKIEERLRKMKAFQKACDIHERYCDLACIPKGL